MGAPSTEQVAGSTDEMSSMLRAHDFGRKPHDWRWMEGQLPRNLPVADISLQYDDAEI